MDAINIKGLKKIYNAKAVVDQLDMTVPQGSIYGFIGRNGSGKSTTLKMLSGLASIDAGSIEIFGKPLSNNFIGKRVGILIEDAGLYPNHTAYENLKLKALCMGLVDMEPQITSLLAMVKLQDTGKKKVRQYSMGMKQRLGVAMAMLGNPDILILDEPINGLDPEGIREMRELLLRFHSEFNMTIVVSSHILSELSRIATHYGIIKDGHMMEQLSAEQLAAQCQDYLLIRTPYTREAASILEEKLKIRNYTVYPDGEIRIMGTTDTGLISRQFTEDGIPLEELSLHKQDLEQYFLHLMEGGH